ncbi:MAG TPA: hypothetical protein VFX06_11020, partial [Stellaceae bacterium]|nr:hypothetical protein [Stellaceae bacterium]
DTLIDGTDLLDISGTPKKLAIELMATALQRGNPRIYQLLWSKRYKEDELPQIGKDRFEYLDLTVLPSTSALRRSYVAKSTLVTGISVTVVTVAAGYILSRWIPSLAFLNDVLVAMSVVAGFAALYLAVRASS